MAGGMSNSLPRSRRHDGRPSESSDGEKMLNIGSHKDEKDKEQK